VTKKDGHDGGILDVDIIWESVYIMLHYGYCAMGPVLVPVDNWHTILQTARCAALDMPQPRTSDNDERSRRR
jgi:hypothetical protein